MDRYQWRKMMSFKVLGLLHTEISQNCPGIKNLFGKHKSLEQ